MTGERSSDRSGSRSEEGLSQLITSLKEFVPYGIKPLPEVFNFILNYTQFVTVLERIQSRIGWKEAKREIALKVKSMVVNYHESGSPVAKDELLHTLITGDPGVGKTMFGSDLAELWAVCGCLNRKSVTTQAVPTTIMPSQPQPVPSSQPNETLLHQQLSIKGSQLKSIQEARMQDRRKAAEAITLLNRLRKRVGTYGPEFQEIKRILQSISSSNVMPIKPNPNATILPIIVPRLPHESIEFGSIQPTFMGQQLPSLTDLFTIGQNVINQLPTSKSGVGWEPASTSKSGASEESALTSDGSIKVKFGVFTRGDFIAKFQGHSTEKTRNLFKEYEGGVIMIDEAYDLAIDDHDTFGKEVLTEINNYMTKCPDKIIFIFAGYKGHMEKTIMSIQPGLARRFKWKFDIPGYNKDEMFQIFVKQLEASGMTVTKDRLRIREVLVHKIEKGYFKFFGGDLHRLTTYVKDSHQEKRFIDLISLPKQSESEPINQKEIDHKIFLNAIERYMDNYTVIDDGPPPGWYI